MAESAIEKSVCKFAADLGFVVRKFTAPGQRGTADRLLARDGRGALMEFKDAGRLPSAQQLEQRGVFIRAGWPVLLVDDVRTGKEMLAELSDQWDDYVQYVAQLHVEGRTVGDA